MCEAINGFLKKSKTKNFQSHEKSENENTTY